MAQSLTNRSRLLENAVEVVSQDGLNTNKNVNIGINGATANLWVAGNVSVGGTFTGAFTPAVPLTLTGANANALAVGATGATNPQFNVDTSTTSVATGLNIKGAAAGSGLALSTLSSGTNENLTIDAKGSGTVTINGTATGIVVLPAGTTIGGSAVATANITSSSANAFSVGQNGTTNPAINIDASTASSVTGLNIKSGAAAGGVALTVTSSGTNENLNLAAKGSGAVILTSQLTLTNASFRGQSGSANALSVGATGGTTNPAFNVDASTASSVTGFNVKSGASGGGVALSTISSATNESMTIAAKGTGTVTINPTSVLTAGGLASSSLLMGASSIGVYVGTGAPTISAAQGSLYLNNAGSSTSTRLYVNSNGSTTWVAVTTAS